MLDDSSRRLSLAILVPLLAACTAQQPTPSATEATYRMKADETLQQAIAAAPPNTTIELGDRRRYISSTIVIDKPITLIGADRNTTKLQSRATTSDTETLFACRSGCRLSLQNLTFANESDQSLDLVSVSGEGRLNLDNITARAEKFKSAAIRLQDNAHATIGNGSSISTDRRAIYAKDNAILEVDGVEIRTQRYVSIVCAAATSCDIRSAKIHGADRAIVARTAADLKLRDTEIHDTDHGLRFSGSGALRVHRVHLHDNDWNSLRVDSAGSVQVDSSHFANNGGIALWIQDVKSGHIVNNSMSGNGSINRSALVVDRSESVRVERNNVSTSKTGGIVVSDTSEFRVIDNNVVDAATTAISIKGASRGVVRKNRVGGSQKRGIQISGTSDIAVVENQIVGREGLGIAMYRQAKGAVDRNSIEGSDIGVYAADQTRLNVHDNTIRGVRLHAIAFTDESGGMVGGNDCAGRGLAADPDTSVRTDGRPCVIK